MSKTRSALLVIDVQVAMFADDPMPHEPDRMLGNIADLLARARASETPVIFVRHESRDYEPMRPGQPGFEVHPAVAPLDIETIIDKRACDAFCETPLQKTLDALDIDHVVIAGMQTEMCVDTACRSALHRDFDVTLAADAHGTWDTNVATAEQIIAHHNRTLAHIPHPRRSIAVKPTADIAF